MSSFSTSTASDVLVIAFPANVIGGPDAVDLASLLRDASASKAVVFDLSAVGVMNSSGLGMLVSSLTTLKKFDVALRLAAVPSKVMSLLTMTHLDTVFTLFSSVDEAVSVE